MPDLEAGSRLGVVDQQRLVVKTLGSRYYDIQLSHRCPNLNRRPYLAFRDGLQSMRLGSGRTFSPGAGADPVTSDGRICGDLGDAVVPRSGINTGLDLPCNISSVRRIERRAFDNVFGKNSREANAMLDASPSVVRPRSSRQENPDRPSFVIPAKAGTQLSDDVIVGSRLSPG